MLKTYPLFFFLFLGVIILQFSSFTLENIRTSGSPGGYSGAAFHGKTCGTNGGCHGGGITNAGVNIVHNIPVEGYTPGQTYVLTVSTNQPGSIKFGFEMASEHSGAPQGTWQISNPTTTRLTGASSVTHTGSGTSVPDGNASWTMEWVAPAVNTGNVDFFAAVLAANSNGSTSGDQVFGGNITVTEAVSPCAIPVVDIGDLTQEICAGERASVQVDNSSPTWNYVWVDGNGTAFSSGIQGNGNTISVVSDPLNASIELFLKVVESVDCEETMDGSLTVTVPQPQRPALSISGDTVLCEGEQLTLLVQGGGFVLEQWSDGNVNNPRSVSTGGEHYAIGNDANGCAVVSDTLTVDVRALLEVEISANPEEICPGDSAEISFSPTQEVAVVEWNTGADSFIIFGKEAGVYQLVEGLDIFGCPVSSNSVEISVHTLSTVQMIPGDTLICAGDSVEVSGNMDLTDPVWNNGVTEPSFFAKTAGKYWLESATDDAGCTLLSDTFFLEVRPLQHLQLSTSDTSICPFPEFWLSLDANSVAAVYQWSNGATTDSIQILESGTYWMNGGADALGCPIQSDTVFIDVFPELFPVISGSIDGLNVGPVGYTYQWFYGTGLPLEEVQGQNADTLPYLGDGLYQVVLIDDNGCEWTSEEYLLVSDGVDSEQKTTTWFGYFQEQNKVRFYEKNLRAQLFTVAGSPIWQAKNKVELDVSYLSQGVYLLVVTNVDGEYQVGWVVR